MSAALRDGDLVVYPEEYVERYRRAGLWGTLTIGEEFARAAERFGDRTALVSREFTQSYTELDAVSDRVAVGLNRLGLEPGERVLMQILNTGWAVVAWYGLLKAGLVPVATLAQHGRHELSEIAAQSTPAAHLLQADYAGQDLGALSQEIAGVRPTLRTRLTLGRTLPGCVSIEDLAAEEIERGEARRLVSELQRQVDPDSMAVLQLSGGTTSTPKLIPRLHAEYWYNARAYAQAVDAHEDACFAHLLPVIHNAGIVCALHAAHSAGASCAVSPHHPEPFHDVAQRAPITHIVMPPSVAQLVLDDHSLRVALGGLERVTWVLGPITPGVREAFETDKCRILQMFGMAEGLCMVTPSSLPASVRHAVVGTPVSALDEVRIYQPGSEHEVAAGECGELCCRGPYTIRGYFRSAERNVEAFTPDAFYRTGDLVTQVTHEGVTLFRLDGRIKDVINRGGEKVNAAEIEELLSQYEAVVRVALVAMPDSRLGERACAFVVPAAGTTPPSLSEVQRYLNSLGVAKFKWPERIEIRESLPLTNVSKVDKVTLRTQIAEIVRAEKENR